METRLESHALSIDGGCCRFVYFYVHVLVKPGGRCGSRCRLLNCTVSQSSVKLTSEKNVDVLVDCMVYGDEGRRNTN